MGREIIEDVLTEGVEKLVALQANGAFKFGLCAFHCYPLVGSRAG